MSHQVLAKLQSAMRAVSPIEQEDCVLRALRFKLVSGGCCAIQSLLWLSREGMPYQLFKVLAPNLDSECKEKIASWPVCMRDWLCQVILEKFPQPDDITSAECLAILESLATMIDCDIAEIESRHAQTRDFCLGRARGWPENLESVACRFLCRRHGETQPSATKRMKPTQRKRRGGGGAWRTFVHVRCKGKKFGRAGVKQLAAEYRLLSAEEKDKYKKIGAAATVTHRAGHKAFGVASVQLPPLPG